jgi:hypothetical protein
LFIRRWNSEFAFKSLKLNEKTEKILEKWHGKIPAQHFLGCARINILAAVGT